MGYVCAAAGFAVAAMIAAACSGGTTCTGENCGIAGDGTSSGSSGDDNHGVGTRTKPPGSSSGSSGNPKPAACANGQHTTLKGKVYDPAGANVLYDVRVFVPSGPLAPLSTGAACDACGAITPAPVTQTLTDSKGEFVLEDVPVGAAVPIVVQTGKWRRKIDVAVTNACAENTVADRTVRLPKNGSEGDMPHIAVTAGGCDALECLLRGVGVDESEFVAGASPAGHIHVFAGEGGIGVTGSPKATTDLWNDAA